MVIKVISMMYLISGLRNNNIKLLLLKGVYMKKLVVHIGILVFMMLLIIVNIINKNMAGLSTSIISTFLWLGFVIQDIIKLKTK